MKDIIEMNDFIHCDSFRDYERNSRQLHASHPRISNVIIVLDNISNPYNIAGCFRTIEALGFYHVAVIGSSIWKIPEVSKKADKWLHIEKYHDSEEFYLNYKNYTVLITADDGKYPLEMVEINALKQYIIVFGNEHGGVSGFWRDRSSGSIAISIRGLCPCLNVNVAMGIILNHVSQKCSISGK